MTFKKGYDGIKGNKRNHLVATKKGIFKLLFVYLMPENNGNLQSSGLKTVVSGHFEPTFYKNVNLEDMLIYF